jgi:cytoskeleton protein RodZ
MSDSSTDSLAPSAGAMLRAAREKRGMHIAALAASIKVPQRKLEALESDRYEELLDLTFTRALAQSVCRTLKIDMQPVLDRLPHDASTPTKLARVGGSLNTPFREKPGREESNDWSWLKRPGVWGTALVVAAAAALALSPDTWLAKGLSRLRGAAGAASAPAPDGAASSVITLPATPLTPTRAEPPAAASASTAGLPVPSSSTAAAGSAPVLGLKASAESWVEVQDSRGQVLLAKKLTRGESAGIDGDLPLRVTIGNATGMQVTFRGQPVDMSANTLGNVARIQLN